MILDAPDHDGLHLVLPRDATEVRPKALLQIGFD
jgi:hypothetical protein